MSSAATKTILNAGVGVTTSDEQTLMLKSNATINGTKVIASAETTIKASTDNKLQVVVDGDSKTEYTFENKENSNVTVEFTSLNNNGSDKQLGNVNILSNGGEITVTTDSTAKVGVTAPIEVEVQKGEATVKMNEAYLSGNKTVTVKEETKLTVEAIAKENAPQALTNLSVDSTIAEIKKAVSATASSDELAQAVKDYLDKFGLSGTGAKVTVAKNSTAVKISFEKAVSIKTITGVK